MKPAQFAYRDPSSLHDALDLLAEHGDDAAILAGGQSLLPLMNLRLARPGVLVDVNRVPGLAGIEPRDDAVVVGALCRGSVLERDATAWAALPVLGEALGHVGHPQIRNRTTIGGNLAHADPASELPAVLAALDGELTLASRSGERTLGWEAFFAGPYTTARSPDEMVVSVRFPRVRGLACTFAEVAPRHGDFALAGACVGLRRANGHVDEARIALCGVAGKPVRARAAEEAVKGGPLDHACLEDAYTAVVDELDPVDDVHASAAYRRSVGATIVCRALQRLWTECGS